jgi:glycerol-3-phosphate responsive antiterminator
MLRVSAEMNNTDIDLQLVDGLESDDGDVEFADKLMEFATAVATRDESILASSRAKLLHAANAAVLVDAAAVAGNFQRMVRIADSTGIPLDAERMEMYSVAVDALDLRRFKTSEHTPL